MGRAAAALRHAVWVCRAGWPTPPPLRPLPAIAVARLRAAGARRVGVAAYFLAPGLLYDASVAAARAAGAVGIAAPLGDVPELVRLVTSRVDAVASRRPVALPPPEPSGLPRLSSAPVRHGWVYLRQIAYTA